MNKKVNKSNSGRNAPAHYAAVQHGPSHVDHGGGSWVEGYEV